MIQSLANFIMTRIRRFFEYLDPVQHLGERDYPLWPAIIITLATSAALEAYARFVTHNIASIGLGAIIFFLLYIIYFAIRFGTKASVYSAVYSVAYYLYLIFSWNYKGENFSSGINTTLVLGAAYLILAVSIGWLKETVDTLIDNEAGEKRRLQAVIEQLPIGVIIANKTGSVELSNRKAEEIVGKNIKPGLKITDGQIISSTYPNGRPVPNSRSPLVQVLKDKKGQIAKIFRIYDSPKKYRTIEFSAVPVYNRKGGIIAVAELITDITQRHEAEIRKEDFINIASHELKTPMTSLRLYLDLLNKQATFKTKKTTQTLEAINTQTDRLQKLVNDLLDVSRAQTGKLVLDKESFNLNDLVSETIKNLQKYSPQKINLIAGRSVKIRADRLRIYQVLTNLINNAIKYSQKQGNINVKIEPGKRNWVTVSVEDFGQGIQKSEQKRIFDRLYQADASNVKSTSGFGLGLYIARAIIEKHRGKIWVESDPGKGSTFFIQLPLK